MGIIITKWGTQMTQIGMINSDQTSYLIIKDQPHQCSNQILIIKDPYGK